MDLLAKENCGLPMHGPERNTLGLCNPSPIITEYILNICIKQLEEQGLSLHEKLSCFRHCPQWSTVVDKRLPRGMFVFKQ